MKWKPTPRVKLYEALGCVADGRVEIDADGGKVYSSSRGKYYTVQFDGQHAIMVNDNSSYWQGYLGYPGIAFLLQAGKLPYDPAAGEIMKGVAWKDINQRYKNDFEAALEEIKAQRIARGDDWSVVEAAVDTIEQALKKTPYDPLGKKTKPPTGY